MASLFNSKHNKYVSIPDWFKDVQQEQENKTETKTTYIGGGGGATGSASGLSNMIIYNKFILEDAELDKDALTFENIVINNKETESNKIGDEITVTGWSTTDYISVAGNSKMIVISAISVNENKYGIVFYDNTKTVIKNVALEKSEQEISAPENAYYFRVSVPSPYDSFSLQYKISAPYTDDQLQISNQNITDYVTVSDIIPEGINTAVINDSFKLLVQPPLLVTKDTKGVIKLTVDGIGSGEQENEMFEWDKSLAAYGYNKDTKQAYSYLNGEQQFTADGNPVMTNNSDFWMYDSGLTNKWIIKTTKPRLSLMDGLMEYDELKDSFIFHKNIITSGGIVMYADLDDVKIPDLYDGLPLDGNTVFWNYDEYGNKTTISATGGGNTGGGFSSIKIEGNGNALTHVTQNATTNSLVFSKNQTFLTESAFNTSISNLKDELKSIFVTTGNDEQTITGVKHFNNGLYIGNNKIHQSQTDVIYIDSNLVVRGGITMYAQNTVDVPSILESLPIASTNAKGIASFNSEYFTVSNGYVTLIPDSVGLNEAQLDQHLAAKNYATQTQVDSKNNELRKYVNDTFVTIAGDEQIITGKKNFTTGGLFINGKQLIYNSDKNYWKLDGDLLVTGGVTMYGNDSSFSPSTIMDALQYDSKTLGINDYGQLYVKAGTGGGAGVSYEFNTIDFSTSNNVVSLKTHIHIGVPTTYDSNTLYII